MVATFPDVQNAFCTLVPIVATTCAGSAEIATMSSAIATVVVRGVEQMLIAGQMVGPAQNVKMVLFCLSRPFQMQTVQ